MKTIRLMGHAGSDIEIGYNSKKNIENNEFNDPLLHSSRILIHNKCLSKDDILKLYEHTREIVNHVCEEASIRPKLNTSEVSCNQFYQIQDNVFHQQFQRG